MERVVKRVFNIGILIFLIGVVFFVIYSNVRDRNTLTLEYHFKDDARVYGLYPPDRVSKKYRGCIPGVIARKRLTRQSLSIARNNGIASQSLAMTDNCDFQELVASPVYLDIRYWQTFKSAKVEIHYEKDSEVDFQIGYKVGKDFQWKLFSVSEGELTNLAIARFVRQAILDIDLTGEYVPYSNVHRWIFSSINVQDLGKAIRIYGIKLTFTR